MSAINWIINQLNIIEIDNNLLVNYLLLVLEKDVSIVSIKW